MTPPAEDLPIRANEAAAVADAVFQKSEGRELDSEQRSRLAARIASLGLTGLAPFPGSLARDPSRNSTYCLAADAVSGNRPVPVMLQMSPASSEDPDLLPGAVPISRMRPGGGREIVVYASRFGSGDHAAIEAFTMKMGREFLPRPQGPLPAIAAGNRHPEVSLPAVFEAYRRILAASGVNMASTAQLSATREMATDEILAARDGEDPVAQGHTRVSIRGLYYAGLWAAIRAGWREGFSAEADHIIVTGSTPREVAASVAAAKEAIRHAAGYTKFTTDTSRLFELRADARHPEAWNDSTVAERFEEMFPGEERRWIFDEFSRPFPVGARVYSLSRPQIVRLAVKFGASLKLNEELFDFIRQVKAAGGGAAAFDFEPSIDEAETLTTPEELIFFMHWLKARGRAAQLVPPNLGFKKRQAYPSALETAPEAGAGLRDYARHKMWDELAPRVERDFGGDPLAELGARVAELAAVARYFDGTLSIHSGSGKQPEVLREIGRATGGRVNYKISGELQLQLFDVLSEQPASSPWRALYDRMVARAEGFAAAGAFGAESELAGTYRELGRGAYLGDASRGRVDGNLFLVFWLGNIVGSRDVDSPDGDRRFFKEKLDEMPAGLVDEVRRRNTEYVTWLASNLRG